MNSGRYENIEDFSPRWSGSMRIGYNKYYLLNANAADAVPPATWLNCRAVRCDSSGTFRIVYQDEQDVNYTDVIYLVAGQPHPVRNVQRLYRYYTGTTVGTGRSYNEAGTLIQNALKLLK